MVNRLRLITLRALTVTAVLIAFYWALRWKAEADWRRTSPSAAIDAREAMESLRPKQPR